MNFSFKYNEKKYTVEDFAKNGNEYLLNLEDGVTVTAVTKEYPDFDANEWVLWFKNSGQENSGIFSDINDCDWEFELKNPEKRRPGHISRDTFPSVTSMNGPVDPEYYKSNDEVSAREFALFTEYVAEGKSFTYMNNDARSSDGTVPVFDVSSDNAGVIVGIGWTGGWRAEFSRKEDTMQIATGIKKVRFYLEPGENLRTTSTVTMKYDNEDKYNKYRRFLKKHFSHKANFPHKEDGIFGLELWGALPSEKMIERIKAFESRDIKVDHMWIDAMWYVETDNVEEHQKGWGKYNGNWTVDTKIHPNKLADVRDAAKEAGNKMLLWCEPEYVQCNNQPVLKEHPDWFIDNKLLYYGNEEALQYAIDHVSEMIEFMDLACYRQDFCYGPAQYFAKNDKPDRVGITEIKHIMGMYRLWDTLLEKYPDLIIDNCASGGRRIDMETLKRSIPVFRSDYQCVYNAKGEVFQAHNCGISKYFPYNGCTARTVNDEYMMRSSYSSSWALTGYAAIFQDAEEEDFKCMKKCVDEYRRIRKHFVNDFYNHGSVTYDDTAWSIWQYHNPDTQEGVVLAFRRCESPHESAEITLSAMTEGEYIFTDIETEVSFNGSNKLKITLSEKRSSVIYEYKLK